MTLSLELQTKKRSQCDVDLFAFFFFYQEYRKRRTYLAEVQRAMALKGCWRGWMGFGQFGMVAS